jgi:transcriptional regulator with XRE-family HTH domain
MRRVTPLLINDLAVELRKYAYLLCLVKRHSKTFVGRYVLALYVIHMFPGNRIRELRRIAGISQIELGARVGLSQGQISNIENGDRNLSLEWMRRIAKALSVSVADLLDDKDNPDRLAPDEKQVIDTLRAAEPDMKWMAVETLDALVTASRRRKGAQAA